jgi:hypothetical protein
MPIENAFERGTNVYVYNEKGHVTAIIQDGGQSSREFSVVNTL